MKDKTLLFLPYLLLILFFSVILIWNINNQDKANTLYDNTVNESKPTVNKTDNDIQVESSDDIICYYTKNGKKYHSTPDCQYLKNSKKIIKATYKEALILNLSSCSGCVGE